MPKKPADFHYYRWDLNLWFGSETRAKCRALHPILPDSLKDVTPEVRAFIVDALRVAASGAYRELIDYASKEGDIPSDLGGMAALCGCSPDVMEAIWPSFSSKFKRSKKGPKRLVHALVSARRRAVAQKRKQQSEAGGKNGQKRGFGSDKEINEIENERLTSVRQEERNKETSNKETSKEFVERETATNPDACLVEPWAHRIYSRHPKKKNKYEAERIMCDLWSKCTGDPQLLFSRIDRAHEFMCNSKSWREDNGQFAPKLHEWLANDGWDLPQFREPEKPKRRTKEDMSDDERIAVGIKPRWLEAQEAAQAEQAKSA